MLWLWLVWLFGMKPGSFLSGWGNAVKMETNEGMCARLDYVK